MLTPPDGLSEVTLIRALLEQWGLVIASIEYRPIGWGSHHWTVREPNGTRWFVTVDDLDTKRRTKAESDETAFGRLLAALTTAADLRDAGLSFVVAPVPTLTGASLIRPAPRFAAALYRYIDAESYNWSSHQTPARQRDLFDLIVKLHNVSPATAPTVIKDDFAVPQRDSVDSAFDPAASGWNQGPYARQTRTILKHNSSTISNLLAQYDSLVTEIRQRPASTVMTHGEPHAGNTMLTPAGLVLIDWDTVLLAPPERDLWILERDNRTVLRDYAEVTGRTPVSSLLELYRIRWDLADLTAYVSRFFGPHVGTEDDEESWRHLQALIDRLPDHQIGRTVKG